MEQITKKQLSIAEKNNLTIINVRARLKAGWDIERAISTPKMTASEAGMRSAAKQKRWDIKRG